MFGWLKDEHNRGVVTLIVTILALLIGGIWTVFTFFIDRLPQLAPDTEVPEIVVEEPSEQVVDVEILLGDYDGAASFVVDENCQIDGAIDWVNRVDNSTIVNNSVVGQVDCRTLTLKRPSVGDSCAGEVTTSGTRMACVWGPHAASLKFNPPIKECGC